MYGRPPGRRQADDQRTTLFEVLVPGLGSRMKERDDAATARVNAAQVRPLMQIAVVACESDVTLHRWSAVLAGNDVLNMKLEERVRLLRDATVFAPIARAPSHEIA
jgi:hypothetical protein